MIDRKFKFVAVNPCNQKVYTEENAVVFCAKDKCLPKAYEEECRNRGCDPSHLESISLLISRVLSFQEEHESKLPDTNTACEIDRCIGGKV